MSQNSSQVKLTGWALIFFIFFGNQGSDDEKVRQKFTMMAHGSKDSEKPKNRIAKFFFGCQNFGLKTARGLQTLFSRPTQARKHESEIRWISKTNLICKELGLVVDIWWWYMAAVVVAVVVYGYGSVVVYGYGFRAVADEQWW